MDANFSSTGSSQAYGSRFLGNFSLGTFTYNHATCKTNIAKYFIRSEQHFIMPEDDSFTNYIRTTDNPKYEPVSRNTIRSEMFRVIEE